MNMKKWMLWMAAAVLWLAAAGSAHGECSHSDFLPDNFEEQRDASFWEFVFGVSTVSSSAGSTYSSAESSNTSGCSDAAASRIATEKFVAMNHGRVVEGLALGGGEYMASLSHLLGCRQGCGAFAAHLQGRFPALVPDGDVAPLALARALRAEWLAWRITGGNPAVHGTGPSLLAVAL